MKFNEAAKQLEGIPYTSPAKGKVFYDLVMERRPRRVLELGFAHGVSTCYFAAAAQEIGDCKVTAVDIEPSRDLKPSIEDTVGRLGLSETVEIHRESSSYTWFLKKEIVAQTASNQCAPKYDMIFIDGPKDWTNDGCAFFLADKLLTNGGTMLFDDYAWSYTDDERTRGKKHTHGYIFQQMSEAEFSEPHVKAIFELLVLQHPSYGEMEIIDNQLAMARKTAAATAKTVTVTSRYSIKHQVLSKARKLLRRVS